MRPRAAAAAAVLVVTALTAAAPDDGGERKKLFAFADSRITESSGLAVSALHDGVVYTHNDSGGGPAVYAVGPDGRTRAVLTLRGASARDWEALAPGRDAAGRPVLWVGDIGDNGNGWWREIRVYRVREPGTLRSANVPWTRYRLRYEDGARDAEALLADPWTGRLYVVSKRASGAGIYAAPKELRPDRVNVLRQVADAPARVTDGAFLPDGDHVVLRGYFSATVLDRTWRQVGSVAVPLQQQGETLAATRDGRAILMGSEGEGADVWQVPLFPSTQAHAVAPETAPTDASTTGLGGHTKAVIGVLGGLLALTVAGTLIPKQP